MRHEIVRYVKGFESVDSVKEDVYLGVIVAIGRGQVGWAKTHENDRSKWSRKKGLLIARRRAALPMGEHRDRMMDDLPDSFSVPVANVLADSLKLPLWTGEQHVVESVYQCKDNDTVITTTYLDGRPDEVSIQTPGDPGALIVGYRDLLQAMAKAKKEGK